MIRLSQVSLDKTKSLLKLMGSGWRLGGGDTAVALGQRWWSLGEVSQ